MRKRTIAIARYSAVVLAALGAISCGGGMIERDRGFSPLLERRIFVTLPGEAGTLTAHQKDQYHDGRRFVSHIRQRCVVGALNPKTHECSRTVNVQITAVEGAKYIHPTDPPKNPQLIAWIENLDSSEMTFDSLLPGRRARYALVVNSVKTPTKRVGNRIEMVLVAFLNPVRSTSPRATFLTSRKQYGHVYECHLFRQPYLSDIDYRGCDPSETPVASGAADWKSQARVTSLLTFAATLRSDDPTWFSCSSGCCTSAYPN